MLLLYQHYQNNLRLSVSSAAMACGPKQHLKCVVAPTHWMLNKLVYLLLIHLLVPTR